MNRKKLIAAATACALFAGGIYFAYQRWFALRSDSRESLLHSLPPDASAVIYLDIAELRQATILKNLVGLGASVMVDQDYKQFVGETGFDYEKDLDRVGIAIHAGATAHYFALADGRFDRRKIETYLRKNGSSETKNGHEVFRLSASVQGRVVSVAFLSNERIAFTDAADLNSEIASGGTAAGRAEWTERFARLAGSPVFALIRQDAAIGAILNAQAPGGFRSPQLVQLLNQLLWISVAGKPEGTGFRVVAEGECPNEITMRQLSDFLNGITLMAQGGLNDPKLRQKMDPAERDAYVQLLNSVDAMRLDRGNSKSVRMAMLITPEVWDKIAKAPPIALPQGNPSSTTTDSANKEAENKAKPAKH
jgi:hypothetical protein